MYDIKQSTGLDIMIFAHDANGDAVTGKVNGDWTKRISKNGAAFGAMTVTITEAENGWYSLTLSSSHTDTLGVLSMTFTASGVKQINLQYRVHARINDDLCYPTTSGRSIDVTAGGEVGLDWANIGSPTTTVNLSGTTVKTATDVETDTADIQSRLPAALVSGRIDASVGAMASNTLTAAALASDAVTEIRSLASGTSDSGTTTTMVDSARTEADDDYWKGCYILFTSGTIAGQCRLITGFTASSDTITFAPATTQAVSTQTYEILPAGRADLHLWLGSVANALVSGRVDSSVGAVASNAIAAAGLATDAVNEIRDAILSDSTPFAGGNINATISSRATPAQVNAEVVDAIDVDTYAELAAVPAANAPLSDKINWLFLLARNKLTQTATTQTVLADDGSTTVATSTISDDGTTATRGEFS